MCKERKQETAIELSFTATQILVRIRTSRISYFETVIETRATKNKTAPKEASHTLIERVQAYSTLFVIRLLNVLSR